MLNMREIAQVASPARIPEVVNAWPVTNVDLKYRVNLDGEKTNFYEENQELDWQVRQWVKINFAKNDMSDVAPLGIYTSSLLAQCTDVGNSSATLEPGSFLVAPTPTARGERLHARGRCRSPSRSTGPTRPASRLRRARHHSSPSSAART